jgi:hypothetical protein
MKALTDTRLTVDIRKLVRARRKAGSRSVIYRWVTTLPDPMPEVSVFSFASPGIVKVTHIGGELPDEVIDITYSSCHFGRQRPWFLCSRIGCGRRAAILYGTPTGFRCRHCAKLSYRSQREQPYDRLLRGNRRMRTKVGGGTNLFEPFPEKPKGMHWSTYECLMKSEAALWGEIGSVATARLRSRLTCYDPTNIR